MSEPLTPAELAELRRLEQAATKGPWDKRWIYNALRYVDKMEPHSCFGGYEAPDGEDRPDYRGSDPDLIAAARNALPRLLDMTDRQAGEIDRLELQVAWRYAREGFATVEQGIAISNLLFGGEIGPEIVPILDRLDDELEAVVERVLGRARQEAQHD